MEEYAPLVAVLALWIGGLIAMHIAIRLIDRREQRAQERTLADYDVLAESDAILASYQRCQEDSREC